MIAQENPYAAPKSPGLAKAEPREGALWYVSEGQLRIRDGASLPDVCLSGGSRHEPGERETINISWCPAWARHLPTLAIFASLISAYILFTGESDPPGTLAITGVAVVMIGLIWLVWGVSKRGRLHLFRSYQAKRVETRQDWTERLVVFAFLFGAGFILDRIFPKLLSGGGGGLIAGASVYLSGSLGRLRQLRTCGFESGWFALANVNPAAIARLEEIQARLDDPPLSRKPS